MLDIATTRSAVETSRTDNHIKQIYCTELRLGDSVLCSVHECGLSDRYFGISLKCLSYYIFRYFS